ncbi:hypothetical protein [Amycolatopsis decaplanina]|nr:hypothetical protein [Amycolatopsis decaplanina]
MVDGLAQPVTDQALGSWLRVLPELRTSTRPLEDPLVLLTCSRGATRQQLADQVGRLVWFPHGDMTVNVQPLHPLSRAVGVTVQVGLHATSGSRSGRFMSAYPQGPAGDRVRWAYRSRFTSNPAGWLVERSAPPGYRAPARLRPYSFGGKRVRGLCYFDRRDRQSRSAALNAPMLGSTHVAWTPNDAYQPETPAWTGPATGAPRAAASPWHSRELGALPFGLDDVAVVVGYFAGGRFAVYDERRDVSCWETPRAFGLRLRKDLAATGWGPMPSRVLLLTDFDTLPAVARRQVARGLDGADLITVNVPSTLFLDEGQEGVPRARIALLPGNHATAAAPEWTSTTATGISMTQSVNSTDMALLLPDRTSPHIGTEAVIRAQGDSPAASGSRPPTAGDELGRVRMPVPVGLPVPAMARWAGGKAALVEEGPLGRSGPQVWFEILDGEGAGVVIYRVSSWGRIEIPGWTNPVPGVGWAKWGHDLVQASSGVVLRGHSGWVGRLAAAGLAGVRSRLAAQGVQRFTLSATPAGVFATPVEGGMVWQIPFYGRVRKAASRGELELGGPGRLPPAVPRLTEEKLSMLMVEVKGELRRLRKPGMARIVVAREDVRAAHGQLDPSLWRRQLSVQGAKIAQKWLTGHQDGVLLRGAGQSVEAEWAHPIQVDPFGSDLDEDEDEPMDIEEVELHDSEVLARRRGAEVILETQPFYQDDKDRFHATKQSALSASAGSLRAGVFGLPELVLWVMPHLPGEARDISLDDGRAAYRMVSEALAGIPGALGDPPDTALADVLRPQDGWEVTELGQAAWIGPSALGAGGAAAAIHFNVGVPVETGYLFRQYLQAQTSADSAWGLHTLDHRHDALRFANEVTAWYLSWRALGRISDRMDRARSFVGVADLSAQAVRSHVLSAYIHAAAIFTEPATMDPVKFHAADLIRREPKDLRRALPAQSQAFLRLFAGRIYQLMVAMVNFRVPDRVARARSQPISDPEERLQDSDDTMRLYWEAALTEKHDHRYVMRKCFKRMTVLDDFDVVDGIPLVVVEVRCYGASKYLSYTEMAQAQDRIADAARHAHVVAQRLREPTPNMLSHFEATLQELRAHEAGHGPTPIA